MILQPTGENSHLNYSFVNLSAFTLVKAKHKNAGKEIKWYKLYRNMFKWYSPVLHLNIPKHSFRVFFILTSLIILHIQNRFYDILTSVFC